MSQSVRQNQESPVVKEPTAAGEGRSAVKQPAEVAGKKPMDEHPVGTEERYAKHSSASGRSHPWHATVALSTPDLSQDRKEAVNLAPMTAQPPPLLALEAIPRLGEKKKEAVVLSTNRKQSTSASRARAYGKAVTLPWEKRLREKPALT
ncbi:hypothetical protein BHM03_00013480 [Ensete ventricosum]|nr:hypothetical protein BHM03_00013480 [Ensete ventricosum]